MDPETLLKHTFYLRALARAVIADAHDIEDVMQDTWLKALEQPPRDPAALRAWLASVVKNLARLAHRSQSRRVAREQRAARPERIADTSEIVAREAGRRLLVDAVMALDEPHRSVILLRYFDGLPPRKIARALGIPTETVRTRVKRALERLRRSLDDRHRGAQHAWATLLAPLARSSLTPATMIAGALTLKITGKAVVLTVLLLALGTSLVVWWSPHAGSRAQSIMTGATAPPSLAATRNADADAVGDEPSPVGRSVLVAAVRHCTGQVLDREHQPIAQARITAVATAPRVVLAFDAADARRSSSDAGGRFALELGDDGSLFALLVERDGFGPQIVDHVRDGDDVIVVLDAPCVVIGTVMALDGTPIAGASVEWRGLMRAARLVRRATSASDGTFRIGGLPAPLRPGVEPGTLWWMKAQAPGFAPIQTRPAHYDHAPGSEVRHDLVLTRGAFVRGRVVDAETGSPIAAASVVVWCTQVFGEPESFWQEVPLDLFLPWHTLETRTSDDGSFTVDAVPARGFHRSTGTAPVAYVGVSTTGFASAARWVPLLDVGESHEVTLRCWPAASLRGRVVDQDGQPLAGAFVSYECDRESESLHVSGTAIAPPWAITDAQGRYQFAAVPATRSGPTIVRVGGNRYPGLAVDRPIDVTVEVDVAAVAPDLVMRTRDPFADCTVVDTRGQPIAGALADRRLDRGGVLFSEPTDALGRTRVYWQASKREGVERESITFTAPGHARGSSGTVSPSLSDPPQVTVTLGDAHHMRGSVRFEDGRPAAGAVVSAFPAMLPYSAVDQPTLAQAITAADGTFELDDLPDGKVNLRATASEVRRPKVYSPPAHIDALGVPVDGQEVKLMLPASATAVRCAIVELAVTDAGGTLVPDFDATLEDAKQRILAERVHPGKSRFAAVPAGIYKLTVKARGYTGATITDVSVAVDQANQLAVTLARGATLRGRLTPPIGVDLQRATLILLAGANPVPAASVELRDDGSYTTSGLRPGRYLPLVQLGVLAHQRSGLFMKDGAIIEVTESAGETMFDGDLVFGGDVHVTIGDARLPGPGEQPSADQANLLRRSWLVLRDARGTTVAKWHDLHRGARYSRYVAPGDYEVTLEIAGETPMRESVHVLSEVDASVTVGP